ncbi:MAG TPA: hydroxyacylglutathione hydrolase [Legionella sp.]|nr:hydroxyacylglutathione hydrolase [Legionella sp.]
MQVIPLNAFNDNYIWLIVDETPGVFDCVDPGDSAPVLHYALTNGLDLRSILLTHHHHDHTGGVEDLIRKFPTCRIYGPVDSRIPYVNYPVNAQQIIHIGTNTFRILVNPGHTATHISYYEPDQGWLFCGDTLFSAGCGRVFDGTMTDLFHSLNMLKQLPPETLVFCAHEYTRQNLKFAKMVEPSNTDIINYGEFLDKQKSLCSLPSTIENELKINPFLRIEQAAVQNYAITHGAKMFDELSQFTVLRNQKDIFK